MSSPWLPENRLPAEVTSGIGFKARQWAQRSPKQAGLVMITMGTIMGTFIPLLSYFLGYIGYVEGCAWVSAKRDSYEEYNEKLSDGKFMPTAHIPYIPERAVLKNWAKIESEIERISENATALADLHDIDLPEWFEE